MGRRKKLKLSPISLLVTWSLPFRFVTFHFPFTYFYGNLCIKHFSSHTFFCHKVTKWFKRTFLSLSRKWYGSKYVLFISHRDSMIEPFDTMHTRRLPKWAKMAVTEKGHMYGYAKNAKMAQLKTNRAILAFLAYPYTWPISVTAVLSHFGNHVYVLFYGPTHSSFKNITFY